LRITFTSLAVLLVFVACSSKTKVLNDPDIGNAAMGDDPQLSNEPPEGAPTEPAAFTINQSTYSRLLLDLNSIENLNVDVASYEQYQLEYQCVAGGDLSHTLTNYIGPFSHGLARFGECRLGENLYSGTYEQSSGRRSDTVQIFNQLKHRTNSESIEVSGTFTDVSTFATNIEKWMWADTTIQLNRDNGDTSVTGLNWQREGSDAFLSGSLTGFVTTQEGDSRGVQLNTYGATLRSSFSMKTDMTGDDAVEIDVDLNFQGNYLTWFNLNGSDTAYPPYPVSDLGSPLTVTDSNNFTTVQINQIPKDTNAQWSTGRVLITAADGSSITMRPDPKDKSQMLVTLDRSGEIFSLAVSDGFQINCPSMIDGCGSNAGR